MNVGLLEGCYSQLSFRGISRRLQLGGVLWKLNSAIRKRKHGGFKFTRRYQGALWGADLGCLGGTMLINTFQLFGEPLLSRQRSLSIQTCFYIDGTLNEYFGQYALFDTSNIDKHTTEDALNLERLGFQQADVIIAMSRRTAADLQLTYGIDKSKIYIVPPGANLPDEVIAREPKVKRRFDRENPLTLGFVGLYPQRKGLDRLAAAVTILRRRHLSVRLSVIGNCPPEVSSLDGVDYLGRINKQVDHRLFVEALSTVDLGCMLSQAELTGIAYLEFLRLGIPVIGTDVGGAIDILESGGTIVMKPTTTAEELADAVQALYLDVDLYYDLRMKAIARRNWAGWRRAVAEIDTILTGCEQTA